MRHRILFAFVLPALLAAGAVIAQEALQPGPSLDTGRDHMADRNYTVAIRSLTEFLDRIPAGEEAEEAQVLILRAHLGLGDFEQALSHGRRFLEQFPESTWQQKVRFLMGEAYARMRGFKDAARIYREQVDFLSGDAHVGKVAGYYRELADQAYEGIDKPDEFGRMVKVKDFANALKYYLKARAIHVDDADAPGVTHRIADCHYQEKRYADAIREWESLLKDHPGSAFEDEAVYFIGVSRLKTGDAAEARKHFREIREKFGDTEWAPLALMNLGISHNPIGTKDEAELNRALASLHEFLRLYPGHEKAEEVSFLIGEAEFQFGRNDPAVRAFEDFLTRFPDVDRSPSAMNRIAASYYRMKDFDRAIEVWKRFLGTWPNHELWGEVQRMIATAAFSKGGYPLSLALKAEGDEAKDLFAQARRGFAGFLATFPTDERTAQAQFLLGEIEHRQHEFTKALAEWSVVTTKYPDSPVAAEAMFRIASVLEKDLNDLQKGIKAYEDLVARYPSSQPARNAAQLLVQFREKSLEVVTERASRTDEPPVVKVRTRNIETLRIRAYRVDLEETFRTKKEFDSIAAVVVEVVKPELEFMSPTGSYEKHRLFERNLEIEGLEGPGAWIVTVEEEDLTATTLVVVSDLAIVTKQSPRQTLVFAQNSRTGEPWAGARVMVLEGSDIVEGRTGDRGVFIRERKNATDHVRVFAEAGGSVAGTDIAAAGGSSFGYSTKVYMYTDRPLYRSGQKVEVKGVYRSVARGSYQTSAGRELDVEIRDPRDTVIFKEKVKTNEFGTFSLSTWLTDTTALGAYRIVANTGDKKTFTATFKVLEYKKPEFTITFRKDRRAYLPGEEVKGKVALRYFFGGPVPNTTVRYAIFCGPHEFDESVHDEHAWFTRDPERELERTRAGYDNLGVVGRGELRTDDDGNVDLTFRTEDLDRDARYVVSLEALDLNRQWVRETGSVIVSRQGFYALLKTEKKVYRRGEAIDLRVTAVDAIHFPVETAGEVLVARRSFEDGRETESVVSRHEVATDGDGRGSVEIKVSRAGEYRMKFAGKDRAGATVLGSALVTIAGETEDLARQAKVVASRQIYREGDTATLLVNTPVAPSWALLTFEGERVLDYRVVSLTERSTTLEIPMKPEYSPNVFVKIAVQDKIGLFEGMDEIYVFQYLEIGLAPDRREAEPGEEVTFSVRTTDQRGNPVSAEVGVSVFDRSILSLEPDGAPQMKPFFYDQRRKLAVATASSLAFRYAGNTRQTNRDLHWELLRRKGPEKFNRTMKYVRLGKDLLSRGDLESAAIEFRKALQISPDNYEAKSLIAQTEAQIVHRYARLRLEDSLKKHQSESGYEDFDKDAAQDAAALGALRTAAESKNAVGAEAERRRHSGGAGGGRGDGYFGPAGEVPPGMRPSADSPPPAAQPADGIPASGAFFNRSTDGDFRARTENRFDKKLLPILKDAPQLGTMFQQVANIPAELRKTFADTAAWEPHVVTDQDGAAKITVRLPDNLTTWRAAARGATKATLVGEGTADVVARKRLLVRVDTPRFLTQRDRVTVTSTVHNNLGEPVRVTLDFSGKNLALESPGSALVDLKPREIRAFDLVFTAAEQGLARVKTQALTGVESDAVETALPVLPHGLRTLVGRSGEIADERLEVFRLPADIVPGTRRLMITLSPGLDGSALESLIYLGGFPWGCLEQTVNRFLPAIAADQALRAIGSPDAFRKEELRKLVEQGLLALYAFQNSDGSFGWFSGGVRRTGSDRLAAQEPGDPFMTALAILGMERAREAGYRISAKHRDAALQAGLRLVKAASGNADKAMLLYALSRGGAADLANLTQVYRYRDGLGAHALATLALAMKETKRMPNAVSLVRLLKAKALTSDGLTHWAGDGVRGAANDVETTALAIRALITVEPGSSLVPGAVRWLQANKQGPRWGSTRDTGAAVLALADHLLAEGVSRSDYEVDVFVNDAEQPYQRIRVAEGRIVEDKHRVVMIDGARLRTGENRIRFVKRGAGPLFYTMMLDYHVAADEIGPAGNLVSLDRRYTEYVSPAAQKEGAEEIRPGWTVVRPDARPKDDPGTTIESIGSGGKFRVRLTLTAREKLPYVIVEDRLPAGVEVVEGQATGAFDWQERRDEKQVFFLSEVPAGKIEITYLVQAIHPGEFAALPAFAYPMYEPAIWGRSGLGHLAVLTGPGTGETPGRAETITPDEIYGLAKLDFRAKRYERAKSSLKTLLAEFRLLDNFQEESQAMLLRCGFELSDAGMAVEAYERLVELNPRRGSLHTEDRRKLACAYQEIGDFERALSLFRSVTDDYFGREQDVAETYRNIENPYRAQAFAEGLTRSYPDLNSVIEECYAIALRYLEMKVPEGADRKLPEDAVETGLMLPEGVSAFRAFLSHYPESARADEANRMMVTVLNRMDSFEPAVSEAQKFIRRHKDSAWLDDVYWYLAESYFHQTKYDRAMATGKSILDGRFRKRPGSREMGASEFSPHVLHLFAKIQHLRGDLAEAVKLYRRVAPQFEDARDALAYLTAAELRLPETVVRGVGEPVSLAVEHKNLTDLELRTYPVDLMLLIAVKKDLRAANQIDLTGIATTSRVVKTLPGGLDHRWHEEEVPLELTEKGVYLVVARSGEIRQASIVIVSDLEISVQVIDDRVRVYATDRKTKEPQKEVFVKISDGTVIKAQGFTDARGVFEGREIKGPVMVVAEWNGHFALFRR